MLSIENVTKKYGDYTALEDITLEMDHGVYGLLAPNGAGKTTLIKMIATLLFPTEGRILWDGMDIFTMGEEYRSLIGYMPQEFGYYRNETAVSYLCYLGALQGIRHEEAERKVAEVQYSGGMLQRVSLAQALLNDPKLLILDEPTAGLDPVERVRFRNLIRSMAGDRIIILSTHIVSDMESAADRIILLKNKKVLCSDTADNIIAFAAGRVFEMPADAAAELSWTLLSEGIHDGNAYRRYYAERIPEGCVSSEPTLEDAFLKIYGENR